MMLTRTSETDLKGRITIITSQKTYKPFKIRQIKGF